jgi:Ala-tRNA(Pro) deacylase
MYIVDFLHSRGVGFETLLHRPAFAATRRARNMRVTGREVAKTVLVKAGEEFVLAVLPATSRIDLLRLSAALRLDPSRLRLATDEEIGGTFRDCEPGTIPPFGRLYGLKTFVDLSLAGMSQVVFTGNTRHEGLRMQFRDYERLEEPVHADFAVHAASGAVSPSPKKGRRRAS